MKEREDELVPMYQQVAVEFADLHDTPGRMLEKGVISDIVKWKGSRKFFYWRLKRILMERRVKELMCNANCDISPGQLNSTMERLFLEAHGSTKSYLWSDNKVVAEWLENELSKDKKDSVISENIKWIKRDRVLRSIKNLVQENPEIAMDSIVHITQQMNSSKRAELSRILQNLDAKTEDSGI